MKERKGMFLKGTLKEREEREKVCEREGERERERGRKQQKHVVISRLEKRECVCCAVSSLLFIF